MALQETETLLKIARNIREMATVLDKRSEAIQTNLFGSEPRDVSGTGTANIAETVELILRDALSVLNSADSQFGRTLERIGDDRINKPEPSRIGYASSAR